MNKLIHWLNIRVDEDTHRKYQNLSREKRFWLILRVRRFIEKLLK